MRSLVKFGLGVFLGVVLATIAIVSWFGWGQNTTGQATLIDPTRSDYIDLMLVIVTIMLGAIGLAITMGAVVIGIVAFKTLREIKQEAADEAKLATEQKLKRTVTDDLARKILTEMARNRELDDVLERVAMQIQTGGPEPDAEIDNE